MNKLYEEIAESVKKIMESGVLPWHKPWTSSGFEGSCYNRVSKKSYSMLNQLILPKAGEYASCKQWNELGGVIKKGSKASHVYFFKRISFTEIIPQDIISEVENGIMTKTKSIPILRYLPVFHIDDVEGVKPLTTEESEHVILKEPESIITEYKEREGIIILEKAGDRSFYSLNYDYISIPKREQFKNINDFYQTVYHEIVHSTGHTSRLKRFDNDCDAGIFGSESYSKEELIAEMASAFLMHEAGLQPDVNSSAAYVKGWMTKITDKPMEFVSACCKAEKACNYILGKNFNAE